MLKLIVVDSFRFKSLSGNWDAGTKSSAYKCLCRGNTIYRGVAIVQQSQVEILMCHSTFLEDMLYCLNRPFVKASRLGVFRTNCGVCKVILVSEVFVFC